MARPSRARQLARVQARSRTARHNEAATAVAAQPNRTILDVIDEFDHGNRMTPGRAVIAPLKTIQSFAEEVAGYWDGWQCPDLSGQLTIHSGAGLEGMAESGEPDVRELLASVLYYPRATFACQLSNLVTRDVEHLSALPQSRPVDATEYGSGTVVSFWDAHQDLNDKRRGLRNILQGYESIRPLVAAGALVPVPQWKLVREHENAIADALLHDVADDEFLHVATSNTVPVRSIMLTDPGSFRVDGATAQQLREMQLLPPSFYLNKLITIANSVGARYVPRYEGEHELLKLRLGRALRPITSAVDPRVIPELARLDLPGFSKLDAATLTKIRRDEEALEDFRAGLQRLIATATSLPDSDTYPNQASAYIRDQLSAQVSAVNRLTAKPSIGEAIRSERAALVVGAVAGLPQIAEALASPSHAGAAGAIAGPIVGGITSVLLAVLGRRRLSGSQLVISGLLRH